MTPLDPLRLPLWGSRLIEASAGTGKTWTIAALMVRLVLGHGPDGEGTEAAAPPRPLAPAEVLVMTFTRAATRELSDRIRARLLEAALCFRGERPAGDPFLAGLVAAYPDEGGSPSPRRAAAHRLALAAEAMDEAAVHTIDAWCQRMLREHAFDSAQLFDETLEADESARRRQAVQDFWRQAVYPLEGQALDTLLGLWPAVDALDAAVQRLLPRRDALPTAPADRSLAELLDAQAAGRRALKAGWPDRIERMRAWLTGHFQAPGGNPFNANKVKPEGAAKVLEALAAWAADPLAEAPDPKGLSEAARRNYRPEGLRAAVKKGGAIDTPPPVFAEFAALMDALADREPPHAALLAHAVHRIARRMARLKRRAGRFGYADLAERLDAALHGPRGEALAQRIRAQFPVALVDEFQDTSPLQYRLFERIYRPRENRADCGLLLIGDPKQSIYGFRGADIYSYLRARAHTAPRHHALDTNRRSGHALVAAVNTLFAQADARAAGAAPGAFAMPPAGLAALPFVPVCSAGRDERLVAGGAEVPALHWWLPQDRLATRPMRRLLAEGAAAQLVAWLSDPGCGWVEAGDKAGTAGPPRRLRPGEVAVLVRDLHEAEAVRHALARRGLPSVYVSERDKVFASPEAADLLRWLRAVAQPLDAALARAAYAGATWALDLAELAAHVHDDRLWDRRVALLQRLQLVWQRQGVLAMLRQSLHALAPAARWAADPGGGDDGDAAAAPAVRSGERRLTNLLHLGELLQAAAARLEGPDALLRWCAAQVAAAQEGVAPVDAQGGLAGAAAAVGDAEGQVVRLESDAQLVQVVTVHKSKGLEYPVVMLPFGHAVREPRSSRLAAIETVDPDTGARGLDFRQSDAARDNARSERLREDLRLLYVALTRARHALWVGVGVASGRGKPPTSALSWLLAGDTPPEPDTLAAALRALVDAAPAAMALTLAGPAPERRRWRDDTVHPPLREDRPYAGRFDRRWGVGSFSALTRDLQAVAVDVPPAAPLDLDRVRDERWRDEWARRDAAAAAAADGLGGLDGAEGAEAVWHRFPRGPGAGNALHGWLEWLAGEGFEAADEPGVAAALRRRIARDGHEAQADGVQAWLAGLLRTPLPPLGAPLAEVPVHLAEMEFWLPAPALPAAALDTLCQARLWPGRPRPALAARTVHGLMMGFADLVFEHGGRWWVLDHKSNALGADDAAYTTAAMTDAMLEHRYDLQAALYLLALHRLLRQRLGAAYDPARQLGGAVYLFLRGWRGPAGGCVHVPADPAWLEAMDRLLDGPPQPAGRAGAAA